MKTIELLLLDTIENLGIIGDVVKVKPGYARNYLLPHGLADIPSEEKIQELAARRAEVEAELKKLRSEQEVMIQKLEEFELTLERAANEQGALFGGVTQHDIAEGLRAEGFAVEDRHIRIGERINRLDTYTIPVQVAKDLKTEIKLWVVSDKPMEAEEEDGGSDEQAEEQPAKREREYNSPVNAIDGVDE
ncbi:MAG: 50S ribosomal protein L9 [Phycisphaerales bacterium JB063]